MNDSLPKLIIFDDEEAFTTLIKHGLEDIFDVYCYNAFPSAGVEQLKSDLGQTPDLVLIDINIPEMNGLEIFNELKANYLPDYTPMIFVTGEGEDALINAFQAGASDVFNKPLRIKELRLKLPSLIRQAHDKKNTVEQLKNSREIAFSAMTQSSELGNIIHTLEATFDCENYEDLSKKILQSIEKLGLSASIKLFLDSESMYFSLDDTMRPVESELIDLAHKKSRILDFGNRTLFNYPHVTLFIRNMPLDDVERYGHLKDILCIIMNATEARVKSIYATKLACKQRERIHSTSVVLTQMVEDMRNNNIQLSESFERIITHLESDISTELLSFNLLEDEEKILLSHINQTMKQASELFDKSIELEKTYGQIMSKLVSSLTLTN